jgi:hypothetical protein
VQLDSKTAKKASALVSELLQVETQIEDSLRALYIRRTQLLDALAAVLRSKQQSSSTPEE